MTIEENKIVTWYCEKCPVHNGKDSDAWDENSSMFKNFQLVHKGHQGWKKGKPKESLKLFSPTPSCAPSPYFTAWGTGGKGLNLKLFQTIPMVILGLVPVSV